MVIVLGGTQTKTLKFTTPDGYTKDISVKDWNPLNIDLGTTYTEPGIYKLFIPKDTFEDRVAYTKNGDITISYTIPFSHTIEPVGGEVTEISEIIVSFSWDCLYSSFSPTTTGIFDSKGVNLIVDPNNEYKKSSNKEFHFKPTNGTIKTPGTYTFRIPASAVSTGFNSYSGAQNEAIEVVYTVVAPPLVPGEAVTPAVGSKVMDLSTITIPFAEPAEVVQDKVANVTLGGQPVDKVTMSDDGKTATIKSSATFDAGTVTLSIPKGLFRKQNSSSVNAALSYSWNVVEVSLGITAPEFIFKGDVENVKLELTNGIAFAGFQLDMVLPEGLTVEPIAGAECDFVLSRDNGHIINDGVVDGKIRLLSYGEEAQEYTGDDGTLVTFAVKAEDNFNGGHIAISNIKFADRDGKKYLLADVTSDAIDSRTYVSSITIAPTALNLETRETAELTVTVAPNDAFNKELEWTSSHPELVKVEVVEGKVVVTALAETGENAVTITATAQDGSDVTAQIPVTVVYTHAQNLAINPAAFNIEATEKKGLMVNLVGKTFVSC